MTDAKTANTSQHDIVHEVLSHYLGAEELNSAIHLWNQHYSRQSLDKLSYFIFEIATTSTLRHLRKEILSDLECRLHVTAAGIALQTKVEQPDVQSVSIVSKTIEIASSIDEQDTQPFPVIQLQALTFFLQQLKTTLKDVDIFELKLVLEEQLEGMVLKQNEQMEFTNWLLYGVPLVKIHTDLVAIQQAVSVMYVIICEYYGPVKADRWMAQAMNLSEGQYPFENLKTIL